MKKILCRVIERVFPEQVARIKETNRAKRTAIQAMLDSNNKLRANGCSVSCINDKLHVAVWMYDRGRFDQAAANCPNV